MIVVSILMTQTTKDSLVLSSKLWFPKSVFTEAEYERIITRLTFIPKTSSMFDKDKKVEPIELFSEENGSIGLPRAFGYSLAMGMGYKSSDIIDLRTDNSGTIDFDFKFKLWDTQEKPVQDTIEALKANHNGAILSMPCGAGKTISSLYIASVLKAPTMVILHDDGLLTQWIDEAKKFLNLKDEDIGIVKQNTCNFKGKRVVFASTKSIHSRANKYPKELFMWPTLVIYDEVHRTGARTFSTWMNLMRSKYILGLSATPRRWDGCEDIFYHNIGEVSAIGEAKRLTPRIFLIRLPLMVPDITNSMGMPLTPIMISRMCGTKTPKGQVKAISAPNTVSIKRNTFIGNDAVEALKAGRRVLILSNRIPQLDELRKYIESRVKTTVGWYIGGMSGKAKKESKECNLVLATYKLGSEGMDIPGMDTLILASPISDVEQAVGRILRLKDGKKEPFVFDYVDPNKAFSGMFNARLKFYNKQNYRVTTIVKS
jgi:superfamily II DNA or RNA helicase